MNRLPFIYIQYIDQKGRGVFTAQEISKADIIEICPVIIIPASQTNLINQTTLFEYYFIWKETDLAIALGFGSLYNHSSSPNAEVFFDFEGQTISFIAKADIEAGAEITIHYHDDDTYKGKLWFHEKTD